MHRNYTKKIILEKFKLLNAPFHQGGIKGGLNFGTDIIVGFPTETESDFQKTYDLCQQIGFTKIHVFRFSPRPDTEARELFLKSIKISQKTLQSRSIRLRQLSSPVLKSDNL
jgi:tRNA A37 methylthiotransferase MiaB